MTALKTNTGRKYGARRPSSLPRHNFVVIVMTVAADVAAMFFSPAVSYAPSSSSAAARVATTATAFYDWRRRGASMPPARPQECLLKFPPEPVPRQSRIHHVALCRQCQLFCTKHCSNSVATRHHPMANAVRYRLRPPLMTVLAAVGHKSHKKVSGFCPH